MYMQQAYGVYSTLLAFQVRVKIQHSKGAKALRKVSVARLSETDSTPSNADNRQLITRVEYM